MIYCSVNSNRFRNPVENHYLKDSLINNNFSAYLSKYDTKIYTYDSAEKPLYNQVPVSYDTLNTIFKLQGKPTTIPNLMYYEKAYDKYSYIYKKTITDGAGKTVPGICLFRRNPGVIKVKVWLLSLRNNVKNIFRNIRLFIPMRYTTIMNWSLITTIILSRLS